MSSPFLLLGIGTNSKLRKTMSSPKITHQYGKIYTWEQMELKSFLDLAMFTDIKVPNAIFAAIAKKMALGTSV